MIIEFNKAKQLVKTENILSLEHTYMHTHTKKKGRDEDRGKGK